jgi:catechol 2,3-dioxygenase-like lactoylglutathione lyase family enzyme
MVKTRGLTHVALAVRDPNRAAQFYRRLLGAQVIYQDANVIQLQTPGSWDVLVFERDPVRAGTEGGVAHFGFRLQRPQDIARAAAAVRRAGGKITEQGEFVPGEPYLFALDRDGYTVELWYELPTAVDPVSRPRRRRRRRPRLGSRRAKRAA